MQSLDEHLSLQFAPCPLHMWFGKQEGVCGVDCDITSYQTRTMSEAAIQTVLAPSRHSTFQCRCLRGAHVLPILTFDVTLGLTTKFMAMHREVIDLGCNYLVDDVQCLAGERVSSSCCYIPLWHWTLLAGVDAQHQL